MNNVSKEEGIILVSTIMMMTLVSILVISLMQGVWLYFKASNRITLHHQAFYNLEAAAKSLLSSTKLVINENCAVSNKNPNQVIRLLSVQRGCHYDFNHHSYVYLLEDLGFYPDLQVIKNEKSPISKVLRLTIMSVQGEVLQIQMTRHISMISASSSLEEEIMSWRYLPSSRSGRC